MYIDANLKSLWKLNENYQKLTPLRNWEKIEKYQVSSSAKLTKKEIHRIAILLIPTLLFITLSVTLIIADWSLAEFLDLLKKNGKYGLSFEGMEQGLSLGDLLGNDEVVSLEIEAFDLSTDPCLPRPIRTNHTNLAWLIIIMFVCFLSCIFSAYR